MDSKTAPSITLEILSAHLLEGMVEPGNFAVFEPDHIMGHDVTTPSAINMINASGLPYLKAADRTMIYLDHFTPPKDLESAEACRLIDEFSKRYSIKEIVNWGEGICHVHMFESDRVKPGEMVAGADSHVTTGGAHGALCIPIGSTDLAVAMASGEVWLEVPEPLGVVLQGIPDVWCEAKDIALRMLSDLNRNGGASGMSIEMGGKIIRWIGDDGRLTIANMAAESSCVTAVFPIGSQQVGMGPDSTEWGWKRTEIDIEDMEPQVALPDSPDKVTDVHSVGGRVIDQVFVGSCTNGRLEDLRILSSVLNGRRVHPEVSLLVIPGSRRVYREAERAGYLRTIIEAGGVISMPTCGPCAGGFLGVLPAGEVVLSTSNRNFRGRMGEVTSKIYLAGAAVAGATAVTGVISHPEEVIK